MVDGMNLTEFGRLPVIFQGRAKPMDTLARNALKVISNKQSYADQTLHATPRMPAIKWLLDEITFSADAEKHPVYYIPYLEVLDVFQLPRQKHFLYSAEQLKPGWGRFTSAVAEAYDILGRNDDDVKALQDKPQLYRLYDLSRRMGKLDLLRAAFAPAPFPSLPTEQQRQQNPEAAEQTLRKFVEMAMSLPERNQRLLASGPPLTVPLGDRLADWLPYAAAINQAFVNKVLHRQEVSDATLVWDSMLVAYAQGKGDEFNAAVAKYQRMLAASQPQGIDLRKIRFEAFFNQLNPFLLCMALYVLAFVGTAVGWLGWHQPLRRFSFWLILFTFCLHTFGLIGRIYISGRPPVTNLYSSAVFIGWGAVLLSILLECGFRISIGNVVAAVAGFATLFIAHNLAGDGDTFTVLQAVLDTQFWLATHVVTINLGYAATAAAGAFGVCYSLHRLACRQPRRDVLQAITRMTYGSLCFAMVFSFVGTVLGGLWADDSWGRFWGWDPKENGALIIVLWNCLVLHARWDRMIADRGLAVLATLGLIAVSWSWFGTNQLGVGLHAYGFTDAARQGLFVTWGLSLLLAALGLAPVRGTPAATREAV
jgi:ABC-type transport system involved in cytochrome c biogenesis permease subunit